MLMYCAVQMALTVLSMACASGAAAMTSADQRAASSNLSGGIDLLHETDLVGALRAHALEAAEQREPHDLADRHPLEHQHRLVHAGHAVRDMRIEERRVSAAMMNSTSPRM